MTGRVRIGLPDDDGDLVAKAFTATEDHKFGIGRALERHGSPGDDTQVRNLLGAIGKYCGGVDGEQTLETGFSVERDNDQGRKKESNPGEL